MQTISKLRLIFLAQSPGQGETHPIRNHFPKNHSYFSKKKISNDIDFSDGKIRPDDPIGVVRDSHSWPSNFDKFGRRRQAVSFSLLCSRWKSTLGPEGLWGWGRASTVNQTFDIAAKGCIIIIIWPVMATGRDPLGGINVGRHSNFMGFTGQPYHEGISLFMAPKLKSGSR